YRLRIVRRSVPREPGERRPDSARHGGADRRLVRRARGVRAHRAPQRPRGDLVAAPGARSRTMSGRPRIALLLTRIPSPHDRGDHVRNAHVLEACTARADVTLFALTDHAVDPLPAALRASGAHIVVVPHPRWASYLAMAAALPGRDPLQVAFYRSRALEQAV